MQPMWLCMTVLDLGCGSSKRGSIGVDTERTSCVDTIADAHCLPFRDCSFDGCVAYSVLEHVNNPLHVIGEVNRILKENGWFKIRVPRDSRLKLDIVLFCATFDIKQLKLQYVFLKSGLHKHQFSTRALKRILKSKGFSVAFVTFPLMRRETKYSLPIDIFQYLRNIYINCQKSNLANTFL